MTQASRAPRLTALARRHGLAAAVLLIFVYLVLRSTGLYPLVFADEWAYSSAARLLPAAQAIVPSWLYLWLFGLTSACGNGFLDCARIVNALLFVASAPFLYQLARQVASERVAAVVTVLSLLAPVNSYTAYFMTAPPTPWFSACCSTTTRGSRQCCLTCSPERSGQQSSTT